MKIFVVVKNGNNLEIEERHVLPIGKQFRYFVLQEKGKYLLIDKESGYYVYKTSKSENLLKGLKKVQRFDYLVEQRKKETRTFKKLIKEKFS